MNPFLKRTETTQYSTLVDGHRIPKRRATDAGHRPHRGTGGWQLLWALDMYHHAMHHGELKLKLKSHPVLDLV